MCIDHNKLMQATGTGIVGCMLMVTTAIAGGPTLSFSDQTAAAGLNASTNIGQVNGILGGGSVADFNRDGWQDIFYPTGTDGPDKLYINNQDGTFTDQAAAWGIATVHLSSAAAIGDYNGDDWPDMFVTCFGPGGTPQMAHHHLYRNTGSGFVDEASTAGVQQCSTIEADGWGGAWGDIDLDGDLDLAICGFFDQDTGNCLMRNNGDGTFTDITSASNLRPSIEGLAGYTPHFVDMDDDRYPEIIWIGDFSTSLYYVNNGDNTFSNATDSSNTSMDFSEMGMTVGDWNEDGQFDFYVSTIGTNNLYMNQGGHTYVNESDTAGVTNGGFGWATVSFDIDHDSRFDLVNVAEIGRNSAFLNRTVNGATSFEEVGEAIGLGFNSDGRGLAHFDYDNDGDQDVIFFPGGMPIILMRNDITGPNANWLRIFLDRDDTKNIPSLGIGAKVIIQLGDRTIMDHINGGSNYLSQSETSAHFGLAGNAIVDSVRVEWTNGMVTELQNVAANQTMTLQPPQTFYQSGFE